MSPLKPSAQFKRKDLEIKALVMDGKYVSLNLQCKHSLSRDIELQFPQRYVATTNFNATVMLHSIRIIFLNVISRPKKTKVDP